MTVSTNPSVANGYTDLSGAQVAAGATGVAGVKPGGTPISQDGTALFGSGKAVVLNRARTRPCLLVPTGPTSVSTAFTGSHNLMMTAPGDFDAVAVVAMNIDASTMTIDACSVAVSERSDTSKTVPIIGGSNYNTAAAAGTQNGFIAVTWNGGSTSVAVPAGSTDNPSFLLSDFTPISSIPRVDDPSKFPLVIVRQYFNARTVSILAFASAAEVDNYNSQFAPYEFYQVAQATVDGATPATASNFTSTWSLGASTQSMRIFGLAFRIRGTSDTVLISGDSVVRGMAAAGNLISNHAANIHGGWFSVAMRSLASKTNPIGYVNLGISGNTSATYLTRAKTAITALRPNVAAMVPYTTNDAPTGVIVTTQEMSRGMDFVETCRNANIAPILMQSTPCARPIQLRLDLNSKIASIQNFAATVDLNTPVYDSTNAANNYFLAGTNFDTDHPNSIGHNLIAASAAQQLSTLLDR